MPRKQCGYLCNTLGLWNIAVTPILRSIHKIASFRICFYNFYGYNTSKRNHIGKLNCITIAIWIFLFQWRDLRSFKESCYFTFSCSDTCSMYCISSVYIIVLMFNMWLIILCTCRFLIMCKKELKLSEYKLNFTLLN